MTKTTNTTSAKSQAKSVPVKQTTQFKAKQQLAAPGSGAGASAAKKTVSKVMNLPGAGAKTSSSPSSKAPLTSSVAAKGSGVSQSLSSVAAKLSHSGVTLSKPDKPAAAAGPR